MTPSLSNTAALAAARAQDVQTALPRFRCGTLADAGTPYDLGFVPGEHVHIQDRGGYSIVHNGSQLRWVTSYQVSAYITAPLSGAARHLSPKGKGTSRCNLLQFTPPLGGGVRGEVLHSADPARQYLDLRAALLASPAGYLIEPIDVQQRPLPARVPDRYKGCPIIMADTSPVTEVPGWMGEHLFVPFLSSGEAGGGPGHGVCTIYLETEYVEKLLDQHRYDILWATFRHERFESRCELALARAEFPTAQPRQWGGLAICMNGLAHKMTVRLLGEAAGEREYNDMLDGQRAELGLGRV